MLSHSEHSVTITTSRQLHLADTFKINTSLLQPAPIHIQVINATVPASQRKNMFLESVVEYKPSVHRNYSHLVHNDSSTFEHRKYKKTLHRKHEEFVHREHDTFADYGKPSKNKCQVKENIYSESQINEYIARAHKMSSSKFIFKCMTAVILPHWSAQKESCLDVRSFKGLNTIYPNIIVASHQFFDNF